MANWSKIFPSGAPFKKIFPASKMATLDAWLENVANWIEGSDHTLAAGAAVILRGASTSLFRVIAPMQMDHVQALTVDPDGTITVQGSSGHPAALVLGGFSTVTANSGCVIELKGGVELDLDSTALVRFKSGATEQIDAGAFVNNSSVLGVKFLGTQPAATADPGANNIAIGTNQVKAWARVTTNGSGGITLVDGYNIDTVAIDMGGMSATVTLKRAMLDENYVVIPQANFTAHFARVLSGRTASVFTFNVRTEAPSTLDLSASPTNVELIVIGRQA